MKEILDSPSLRVLYYRIKDSQYYGLIVSGVIFLITVILFFNLILPQINQWFSINAEVAKLKEEVRVMKESERLLMQKGSGVIDGEFSVLSKVLPFEKDYVGIYNSISAASLKTGIEVLDYSISIGDISTPVGAQADSIFPYIEVPLTLQTDVLGARRFIDQIMKSAPVSEVVSWSTSTDSTNIKVRFYYKGISTNTVDPLAKVEQYSPSENKIIIDSSNMVNESVPQFVPVGSGSSSSSSGVFNYDPL